MNASTQKPRRGEFRGENHDGSHSVPTLAQDEDTRPLTSTDAGVIKRSWDVLQSHPIAAKLEPDAQLALLCEYVDLYEDLQGMSLAEYLDCSFSGADAGVEARADALDRAEVDADAEDDEEEEESPPRDGAQDRPKSLIGLRVVYKFPGRNVLSDEAGVTRDSDGTVAFVDVDGENWSNVSRAEVHPIDPANYREIHVMRREAKEIAGWLAGKPSTKQPEGDVLRNLTVEFAGFPDRIVLAVVNAKRPYVDRFVQLPENNFEDDQKPTTRLFGEHCFRVRGVDWIVNVMTP
jgi:hypothetical protein